MLEGLKIGIAGSGAIGGFIGVRLSAAGVRVVLVGRPNFVEAADQLQASPIGAPEVAPGPDVVVSSDLVALRDVEVCLITVKSGDTEQVARRLAEILAADTPIVSLQNGLHNAERITAQYSGPVVPALVTYNVFRDGPARMVQATTGKLVAGKPDGEVGRTLKRLSAAMAAAGERLDLRRDIRNAMAGKVLLNLNNGVCAATGMTIVESLRDRNARWCFATCLEEGLAVMRSKGFRPVRLIGLPPALIAYVLRLPNAVVLRVAKRLVSVDPQARSSTLQDLARGRQTEIDDLNGEVVHLNGEIVRLADVQGAPANRTIVEIVREHEANVMAGVAPTFVAPDVLRERIEHAMT